MADKKFSTKAGYGNLLDYDPANGIVKYGSYEAFVDQVVKPTKTVAKFSDYQLANKAAGYSGIALGGKQLKTAEEFAAAVASGEYNGVDPSAKPTFGGANRGAADYANNNNSQKFRKVNKLGPDSFEIENYEIPNSVDFINKLADSGASIAYQDSSDILKQNQSDASSRRQGRGATSLGSATGTAAIS